MTSAILQFNGRALTTKFSQTQIDGFSICIFYRNILQLHRTGPAFLAQIVTGNIRGIAQIQLATAVYGKFLICGKPGNVLAENFSSFIKREVTGGLYINHPSL